MERFKQDNTEGYSDADLRALNVAFQARCNMLLSQYKEDDDIRDQVMERWAEEIQAEFDSNH